MARGPGRRSRVNKPMKAINNRLRRMLIGGAIGAAVVGGASLATNEALRVRARKKASDAQRQFLSVTDNPTNYYFTEQPAVPLPEGKTRYRGEMRIRPSALEQLQRLSNAGTAWQERAENARARRPKIGGIGAGAGALGGAAIGFRRKQQRKGKR